MERFRSKSCRSVGIQMESPKPNWSMQDLRCYSASYASPATPNNARRMDKVCAKDQWKLKKGKSANGSVFRSWNLSEPELQRKKRVASCKAYSVEGKVKGSIKKSLRWIKERYTQAVYGCR